MRSGRPRTIRDMVLHVEQRLKDTHVGFGHGTDNARDEAAWLVTGALKIPPHQLLVHLKDPVTGPIVARIRALLAARIRRREPLSYLLKEAWFAGLRFYVDRRVIVPRSLIGEFLMPGDPSPLASPDIRSVLDLCTGSGAIAIAAARAFPHAHIDAVDISVPALAVASRNIRLHHLEHRVHPIVSDLFTALPGKRYDLILCNPPYVSNAEMRTLPTEYQREPRLALAAGRDGLDLIIPILEQAAPHLTTRGRLVLEVGASRVALEKRFPNAPLLWLASTDDMCVGYWEREDLETLFAT